MNKKHIVFGVLLFVYSVVTIFITNFACFPGGCTKIESINIKVTFITILLLWSLFGVLFYNLEKKILGFLRLFIFILMVLPYFGMNDYGLSSSFVDDKIEHYPPYNCRNIDSFKEYSCVMDFYFLNQYFSEYLGDNEATGINKDETCNIIASSTLRSYCSNLLQAETGRVDNCHNIIDDKMSAFSFKDECYKLAISSEFKKINSTGDLSNESDITNKIFRLRSLTTGDVNTEFSKKDCANLPGIVTRDYCSLSILDCSSISDQPMRTDCQLKFATQENKKNIRDGLVYEAGKAVLLALKDRNYQKLEELVIVEGLSFSHTPFIDYNKVTVSKDKISDIEKDTETHLFGYSDGKGDPIILTNIQYMPGYSHDYLNAHQIAINQIIGIGNSVNTIIRDAGDRVVVAYHFNGFDPKYEGTDWVTLYLVFQEEYGFYKLRAIASDNWTI